MMAGEHPDELTLLAYVEGELRAAERGTLAAHVAACPACADSVRRLETAREALRAAPLLELPEDRRSALFRGLPERKERFGFLEPFRHGLGRAAPALAALVLIAGIVALATQAGGGGDDEEGAQPALEAGGGEAERDAAEEGAETVPELASPQDEARTLVQRVRGPAREVAELLRVAGFDAVVRNGSVVVTGDAAEVRQKLECRPRGRVRVLAQPPR